MSIISRIRRMFSRGAISSVDDSKMMQSIQVTDGWGQVSDDVEKFEQFGFTSNPPDKSECLLVGIGGDDGNRVAMCAIDRTKRPTGKPSGSSTMYASSGDSITIDSSGNITMSHTLFLKLSNTASNHAVQRELLAIAVTNAANAAVPTDGGKVALLALAASLTAGAADIPNLYVQ